jgi:hypothetical protein
MSNGDGSAFTEIQGDLFGRVARLQSAHFGMDAPSAEGARRFHIEISHALQMTVHHGAAVLERGLARVFHDRLAFLIGYRIAPTILFFQMGPNGRKVALFKLLYNVLLAENGPKASRKVLYEDLGRGRIAQMHAVRIGAGGHKCRRFLLLRRQHNGLFIVQQPYGWFYSGKAAPACSVITHRQPAGGSTSSHQRKLCNHVN